MLFNSKEISIIWDPLAGPVLGHCASRGPRSTAELLQLRRLSLFEERFKGITMEQSNFEGSVLGRINKINGSCVL